MDERRLSSAQISEFHEIGYTIVPGFFSKAETDKLYGAALEDEIMRKHALDLNDQSGKKTKLSLWYTPGDDIYGQMIRSERMVNSAACLLNSEAPVCHFHTKLMQKEPRVGGAWEWHQDYGYWYKNQFMFPDQMLSVMIALTAANKENGCLQVIKGSHKMGRVNHGFAGEQVGADMVMVDNALKTMELVYCELQPGDALFFHSNLLHRSEANLSDRPRWSIISVYVSQSNPAYNEETGSRRTPVAIVPDEALLETQGGASTGRDFLRKEEDKALEDTGWESGS
ncbi:ectoine hydroxylase-related dioxygenase (phytanoyl-CoA dioxygenase family) [Anseongella ginsenosidimutans]|uniref:Ectoine hydroxylase-related dioxygenase (Phytanoyl-CoA dioxygenase family) n=1 Tax=Anseongella ginsenosidimutans TaxID=496056 RepID=A0A4R3KWZ3_9SPHI|nr:phytanoyl-CoA dioxygenase family protein [Anseongella ginsenosidimutans]QEC51011.1 phytanoyl-CoA dioxygenase family protein [Anseongella ginsenosidimutans]TCS90337.1 ectoine hydroxylase-related dioxygenase (phytanoyl-CoA dioxygenase family) [Anseongella ginsenosidimutans]